MKPNENPQIFEESIGLNMTMTPQEAIENLAIFHNTTCEEVLAAFMNLRGFEEGTVEFRESVNNGNPCIVMEGKTSDGIFAWNHLINKWTGQPQVQCG